MLTVHEKFLNYVKFDTQSSSESTTCPSTDKQKKLAAFLVDEMKSMGIQEARMDEYGYVYGSIPSNTKKTNVPAIGFIAHMDTSPAMSGYEVKPQVIKAYDGNDIVLNKEKNIVMKISMFDKLKKYIGHDLIVTDGTTLLGADNKAGIAEILSLAEFFANNPQVEHGTIKIGFTPDEEIGRGADKFDVEGFGADFAYTVDGNELGELEYENFNAASAKVTINGANIHPGAAKHKMKNSILIAMEFQSMLPVFENPAYTEKYEGFNHLDGISGNVEMSKLDYIIRDHDMEKFKAKKERFEKIAEFLNHKYGENTIVLDIYDTYYNMKEKILPHMHIIETAMQAMRNLNIEPTIVPIRGGTDGARLSYMGLPCPNLCAGGLNYHGKYEFISIQSMEKIVEILKEIVKLYNR